MEAIKQKNTEMTKKLPTVRISGLNNFDVNKIFDCGQCFRFDKVENSKHSVEFSGIAFGKFVSFAQDGTDVYIYNSTQEEFDSVWRHYLSLDVDYSSIDRDILSRSSNPELARAVTFGNGIRILSQDMWETVCSFIISQNNNIPRIKKIIESLSLKCGSKIEIPEEANNHLSDCSSLCTFPTPEAIVDLGIDGLYELKTGFRAKYIYDAAQKVLNGELDFNTIINSNTKQAVEHLCKVKGIGPKVALCALLFGFGKYDAFPIDVWIKKVIAKYFTETTPEKFDATVLGPYAGIAQQYLFYYERYGGYKEY